MVSRTELIATTEVELLDAGAVERVRAAWLDLERLAGAPLAVGWAWTESWLDAYGDLGRHGFAIVSSDGAPQAIALLVRGRARSGGLRLRTVHLGTAGEPDGESVYVQRNGLLAAPGQLESSGAALRRTLAEAGGFHELRLDGFLPEHGRALTGDDPSFRRELRACPVTDLRAAASTGGEVLALFGSNTRSQTRRGLRAFSPVDCEWAETSDQAQDIFAELVELHQQRWMRAGQPGAFASERVRHFHRRLIAQLHPEGRVILFRVRSRQQTVGCLYHLVDDRDVLYYQVGLTPVQDNRRKPGFVTHALCMQACYERGLHLYDLLSGDSVFKRQMSTGERALLWARGLERGATPRAARLLRAARRRLHPRADSA